MKLENSTSSFDTTMAQEMAVNQVVTEDKSCLNKLSAWIMTNSAKLSLVWILTFANPNMINAQTVDVAKNEPKKKIENTIWTAKKDTNAVEKKVEPEWAREYKKATLNTIDFITKNSDLYVESSKNLPDSLNAEIVARQTKIVSYSKLFDNMVKILLERPFNEKEQKALKNIQKNLTERSTAWLNRYIDKIAYLTLQELNPFISTFEQPLMVKNNQ